MSPKITVLGGPSHAGDPQPPSRRQFGAALAAARKETTPEPAAERSTPPVRIVVDYRQVDATLLEFLRQLVRGKGWHLEGCDGPELPVEPGSGGIVTGPVAIAGNDPVEVYATGGVLNQPFYVGEQGPGPISAADLERLGQRSSDTSEPTEDLEVPVDSAEHEPATEVEGGEPSSAGTSSSTSPKKRRTNSAEPKPPSRSRARGMGSRSKQGPEADSTAGSADAPTTTSSS